MVKLEAIVASHDPTSPNSSSSSPPLPSPNSHLHSNNPPSLLLPHLQYPQPQPTYYNYPYPNYEYNTYAYNYNYNPLIVVPIRTIQYPFLSPQPYYYSPESQLINACPTPHHFYPQPQPVYNTTSTNNTSGSHSHFVAVGPRGVDGNRNGNGNQKQNRNGFLWRKGTPPCGGGDCGGRKGYRNGNGGQVKKMWKPKQSSDNSENGKGNGNGNRNEEMKMNGNEEMKMKGKGKGKECGPCYLHHRHPTSSSALDLSSCTTVMIKNIPNRISRKELIDMLDHHCWKQNQKPHCSSSSMSEYDFIYLPFDFMQKMNMGYAFVNFTSVEGVEAFNASWTGKGWAGSSKIRLITRAKLQGIEQCKKHFQKSVFYCQSEEFLPVQFCPPRNGSNGNACKITTVGNWVHDN